MVTSAGSLRGGYDLLAHPDADSLAGPLGSGHDAEQFIVAEADALDVAAGIDL